MKYLACSLLLATGLPAFGHSKDVCPEAKDAVRVNIPGYDREPNAVQPRTIAALDRCIKQYPICLLLNDGKIVSGSSEAQVRVVREAVVFAFVQHLRTPSRSYCASASLLPEVGGDVFWSYRTFTPNGGWIGEEVDDSSTRPKTSGQVFRMLHKNFELFKLEMAKAIAAERDSEGDYGYRNGETP